MDSKTNKYDKILYIFVGFIIFYLIANYLVPNLLFNILVIIIIIISGFVFIMSTKVQQLMFEWHEEFTSPMKNFFKQFKWFQCRN